MVEAAGVELTNRARMTTACLPPAPQHLGPSRARTLREPPRPQPDAGPEQLLHDDTEQILDDIARGRFRSVPENLGESLNIISCPSCSRVENEAFVDLAEKVREVTAYARDYAITIAVMGCRVNGPGETDDADLGLWCAPAHVNLKRKSETIGTFGYDEVLSRLKTELDRLIDSRGDLLRGKRASRRS